jgi:hypothetical protein
MRVVMLAFAMLIVGLSAAVAAIFLGSVVLEDPVDYTPQLVATVDIPRPHIDAIEESGGAIFAAGLFDKVARASGAPALARQNFVSFDAETGAFLNDTRSGYSDPVFDGQVWALARYGNSIFVGGEFTTVNGEIRKRLVKINAMTGDVDMGFNARFRGGIVWDLKMWNGPSGNTPMLIVGGSMGKKLMALNPVTGSDTGYFNLNIADPIPNARGGVAVNNFAINETATTPGDKLVATGNFLTVDGQSRERLFVADLSGTSADLDPWYYLGFKKKCVSTHPRRLAYLQGVDFSPDGSYFVVTSTGINPLTVDDTWPDGDTPPHSICDAAARFDLSDMSTPVWVNYTGGDSIWTTAVTGSAVYVQGHFKYLNNPGRLGHVVPGAVSRPGIGAINPDNGLALEWNPEKPAQMGGKAFLVTPDGLWVGSDSQKFFGENHRGIAFAPLP